MKQHKQLNLSLIIQPDFDTVYRLTTGNPDEYLEQLPSGASISADQLGRGYDALFLGDTTHGLPELEIEDRNPVSYLFQRIKDFHSHLTYKNIDVITNYQTDLSASDALLGINMKLYEFIDPISTLAHNARIKPVHVDPTEATIKQIRNYFTNNAQAQNGLVVASSAEQADDIEQRIKQIYEQADTKIHVMQTQFF